MLYEQNARLGNDANLGNVATPLGARLVTTTPRSGDDAPPLGDDAMLLGNDPMPFGDFKTYLSIVHQWKEELFQQDEEDDNHEAMPSRYLPENLPHNYNLENVFLEQFSECNTEVDFASKCQGDMVMHLYPNWR